METVKRAQLYGAQTGRWKRQECTDRQKEKEDLRRSALTGGKEWQECEHLPVNVALLIPVIRRMRQLV